jgi:hypothetical protein
MKSKQTWRTVRQTLATSSTLTLCVLAQVANARAVTWTYPSETHGIWFDANPHGRQQCRDYKAVMNAREADKDVISAHLVGATVIGPQLIHDYAEYGEGNFYVVESDRVKLDRRSWQVLAFLGIDGLPARGAWPTKVIVTMTMSGGKLYLRYQEEGVANANYGTHSRLVRCAKVPEGMYDFIPM